MAENSIDISIRMDSETYMELMMLERPERLARLKEIVKAQIPEKDKAKLNRAVDDLITIKVNSQKVVTGKKKAIDSIAEKQDAQLFDSQPQQGPENFQFDFQPSEIKRIVAQHKEPENAQVALKKHLRELLISQGCGDLLDGPSIAIEQAKTKRVIPPNGMTFLDSVTTYVWYTVAKGMSFEKTANHIDHMMNVSNIEEALNQTVNPIAEESLSEITSEEHDPYEEYHEEVTADTQTEKEETNDAVEEIVQQVAMSVDSIVDMVIQGKEDELTAEHYNYLKTQDINSLEELKNLIPPHLQPMAREQH